MYADLDFNVDQLAPFEKYRLHLNALHRWQQSMVVSIVAISVESRLVERKSSTRRLRRALSFRPNRWIESVRVISSSSRTVGICGNFKTKFLEYIFPDRRNYAIARSCCRTMLFVVYIKKIRNKQRNQKQVNKQIKSVWNALWSRFAFHALVCCEYPRNGFRRETRHHIEMLFKLFSARLQNANKEPKHILSIFRCVFVCVLDARIHHQRDVNVATQTMDILDRWLTLKFTISSILFLGDECVALSNRWTKSSAKSTDGRVHPSLIHTIFSIPLQRM